MTTLESCGCNHCISTGVGWQAFRLPPLMLVVSLLPVGDLMANIVSLATIEWTTLKFIGYCQHFPIISYTPVCIATDLIMVVRDAVIHGIAVPFSLIQGVWLTALIVTIAAIYTYWCRKLHLVKLKIPNKHDLDAMVVVSYSMVNSVILN